MTGSRGLWGRHRVGEKNRVGLLVFQSRKPDRAPGVKKASHLLLFLSSWRQEAFLSKDP